jgi:thioredoxin 1
MRPACGGAARPLEKQTGSEPTPKDQKEESKMEESPQTELVKHVSETTFENEVLKSERPVLVDFWASWCGPCRAIAPIIDQLASKYEGRLSVAKVNVDENSSVAAQFGVRSIPSLLIFKGGQVVGSVVGARPLEEIERFVGRWV